MSKNYTITGDRFQRLYRAEASTSSYAASADAATVDANLRDVEWAKANARMAVFPMHGGKPANDEANVSNRDLFDAVMFCAEHDTETGRHRAYAQAACYRFLIPESGKTLESLTATVACDPYTPDGARISIYTSDDPYPPRDWTINRTGTAEGTSASTVVSDADSDGLDDTWTTTGRYADHVAPRRETSPESGSAMWYTGSGQVVFAPTGGMPLKKYLFVFVLLENYNVSRSGYLEGSAYIQSKVEVVLDTALVIWDQELVSGRDSVDAGGQQSSNQQYGTGFPIALGGSLPLVDPALCNQLSTKDRYIEAPLTDTCIGAPDTVRQYIPSSDCHLTVVGSPMFDIISSAPWDLHVAFGESLAGRSVDTGVAPRGAAQLIYSVGTDLGLAYNLFTFPMFNCFVRYHQFDTTPYSQVACIEDASTTIDDYWPKDYSVPKPVLECARREELLVPGTNRMRTVDAELDNYGIERDPVLMYSPYSEYTHKGMVSVGANISSISCCLNALDTGSPLSSFAPGVRILVSSYVPSAGSDRISSFFEFVKNPTVYGLSAIQSTEAYSMLSEGTATSVFIGDPFGVDADSTTAVPDLTGISSVFADLGAHVPSTEAVMLKDVLDEADYIDYIGQSLGGAPVSYTGWIPSDTTVGTTRVTGGNKAGLGGDQQLVCVFTGVTLGPTFAGVSNGYYHWASSVSAAATSVSYPICVTDGEHTYVLAIMRLLSRMCPDVVAYPISADVNRYAPSISTIAVSTRGDHYTDNDTYWLNVKPCFMTSFLGTFVQIWAPDDTVKAHDFGACKGIRRSRMMVPKATGSWVTFDTSSGKATVASASVSSLIKPYTYANDTQAGTCSFTYSGTTISGVGEIFGVYAPPVKYGGYVYVYGAFTSFGGMPCRSIVRVRFVDDTPAVDGIQADRTVFPLVRPDDDSSSSSEASPVRFLLFPAQACSSSGTFLDDDVYVFAKEPFVIPSIGAVNSCQISLLGSSAVVSRCPVSVSDLDAGAVKNLLVADATAGILGYTTSSDSARVYETQVYPEDSELFSPKGDRTIGLRNCMARFYEGQSALSPTVSKVTVGPVFLVGRAKKTVKAWASTAAGQQIVGKDIDVWRIIFSSSCIPFSIPAGTRCTRVTIDWSQVKLSEDPDSTAGEVVSSSSGSSGSGPAPASDATVSRYAKCTRGTRYNVWLNRSARVGYVPDEVAVDHAFYDATKTIIGDWELVATIDPYSETRSVDVGIAAFEGEVGTIALSAWYPFTDVDPRSDISTLLGSGEATEYSFGHTTPRVGYGFVPDIAFGR